MGFRSFSAALTVTMLLGACAPNPITKPISNQVTTMTSHSAVDSDPYLWLEDVQGDKALAWVRERNGESEASLQAVPGFSGNRDKILSVLNNRDQIPYVSRKGDYFYNFWRDAQNPRGLWRRASLAEYRKPAPAWDVLLDLDALAKSERENWVWSAANCLGPSHNRCLVSMSRGGADATVMREFDIASRSFVPNGFALPEAKSRVDWLNANTVFVATDFGSGSLTQSGYPRIVKKWTRGTALGQRMLGNQGLRQIKIKIGK